MKTTRSRVISSSAVKARWENSRVQTGLHPGQDHNILFGPNTITKGSQTTVSEGHPFRSSKMKGKTDLGGDFSTTKQYIQHLNEQSFGFGYTYPVGSGDPGHITVTNDYTGPCWATNPVGLPWPSDQTSSKTQLNALGTTAIARVNPTNPVAHLTAALGDLRNDGLPLLPGSSLWEDKINVARSAGGEYLNVQYGYLPTASDIAQFGAGVANAYDVIQRYKQGIGKPTRESYYFPSVNITNFKATLDTAAYPYMAGIGGTRLYGDSSVGGFKPGTLTVEAKLFQQTWFKGAFTYYFPYDFLHGKLKDYAILAQQLGLEAGPDVLWQIAPWSWAVDWFSNVGDVITNFTRFHQDGLVMTYGYVMQHTLAFNTYKLTGCLFNTGFVPPVQDVVTVTETKTRIGATPYGFGLNFGALSGFQKSIMAALGLTKLFR